MRRLFAVLLALALSCSGFASSALADTTTATQTIAAVGCEVSVPDDWELTATKDVTVLATPVGSNPVVNENSAKGYMMFIDYGIGDAKQSLPMMLSYNTLMEGAAGMVGSAKMKPGKIGEVFDLMSGDSPIRGYVVSGRMPSGLVTAGTFYLPSTKDKVVMMVFKLPADGSQDASWFFDGMESVFPEFSGVREVVERCEADAKELLADAQPEEEAYVVEPLTDAELAATLETIKDVSIEELNRAFVTAPERAYWALLGDAIPLKPVFKHFEALGLTKPKASKNALSFTVPKEFREQWGDNKTIKVPVEGLATKALTAPDDSLLPMIEALEAQTSAPVTLGQAFAENPQKAYFELLGDEVPLAPVLKWLEKIGLTKAKGGKSKDGSETNIAFTIPKANRDEWFGEKSTKFTYTVALTDTKALTAPRQSMLDLVDSCSQLWAPASDFSFTTGSAVMSLTGCKTSLSGDVVIPTKRGVLGLDTIGEYAFREQNGMTSVVIPDSVYRIGNTAFAMCEGLERVDMGNGVTLISYGAFSGCHSLSSVNLSDRLLAIGDGAFQDCANLKSIVIPDGVVSIGSYAFNGSGLQSVFIPDSVTNIGDSAFSGYARGYGEQTTAVLIVNEGSYAHRYATERGVPYAVIGYAIEEGGAKITGVECEMYGSDTAVLAIPAELGGQPVTAIGERVFADHYGMGVSIPEGVTSIGAGAFADCSGVRVSIPASVTDIAEDAFTGEGYTLTYPEGSHAEQFMKQHGVSQLLADASGEWKYLLADGGAKIMKDAERKFSGEVAIPEELDGHPVTGIGTGLFRDAYDLTGVIIPASVTSIEPSAFENCYQLTGVELPADLEYIAYRLFAGCSGLTGVSIPQSVTSIAPEAFQNCYGLTELTIPANVTGVGDRAFAGCGGLTSVTIQEGVIHIGQEAFQDCYGIANMLIPESVTGIGKWAFSGMHEAAFETSPGSYAEQYLKDNADNNSRSGAWMEGMVAELISDPLPGAPQGAKGAIVMELPENSPNGKPWAQVTMHMNNIEGEYVHAMGNCLYVDANEFSKIGAVWSFEYDGLQKKSVKPEGYYCSAMWLGEEGKERSCMFWLELDGSIAWSDVSDEMLAQVRYRFVPLDGTPEIDDDSFGNFPD